MSRPARSFCDRFIPYVCRASIKPEQVEQDQVAIPIQDAERILLGIPPQAIPAEDSRGEYGSLRTVMLLCAHLDDTQVGAVPGNVSTDQCWRAWGAAGFEEFLRERRLRDS